MAPISEVFEVGLDSLCKGLEVAKPLMKEHVENIEVHVQIAVHQHVSKTRNTPKLPHEFVTEHAEAPELVDCAGVIRHIATSAGRDVGRDVERILGATWPLFESR